MRPDDLIEFVRRKPFLPFRIHVTDGQSFDVRHPEQVLVLKTRVLVAVGGKNGIGDRSEHIALIHVVRIEDLADAPGTPQH